LNQNNKVTLLGIAALNDVKLFNDTGKKDSTLPAS
jgi:hypothetical protein